MPPTTPVHSRSPARTTAFRAIGLSLASTLWSLLCFGAAAAQGTELQRGRELNAHAGLMSHDDGRTRALQALFGARAVLLRRGPVDIGAAVDWWPSAYGLGSNYDNRQVTMNYLAYAFELMVDFTGPHSSEMLLAGGMGGETITFGDRQEASSLLPERSTSPAASLAIGNRYPLTANRRVMLRTDLRARFVRARIFDPAGIREGRALTITPEISVGLSHVFR